MFQKRRKRSEFAIEDLERSLTTLSTVRRETEASDDFVGPLGLNLLYSPPTPLLEFIFVHGLRGGSRQTWSYSSNPYHYWPKEWLPRDPEFKNARIFSFGYNSDWADRKDSVLNVHDFGKSLLSNIANSPAILDGGDTPIIFVGHSMGGIVIKKACILAKQDANAALRSLFDRIKAAVFLATPHRGAESATLLKNLLQSSVVYGEKPFVPDLERNSAAIQSTNDEFRHCAPQILLSFYETMKTSLGYTSTLIVSKDSATLGYPNEESSPLNASHRGICKFESPSDSNFVSIRNSLVRIGRDLSETVLLHKQAQQRQQFQTISDYLGVTELPEDDLLALEDLQHPGSCEWLTRSKLFQSWRDLHPGSRPHYWLTAQPAAGKSVMVGHVIRNLENLNIDYSYYFFKHNNAAKSSLSGCLRSLAYQMAHIDYRVRQQVLSLKDDGVWFEKDNEQGIWRKIFLGAIFQISLDRPHYFVIDALDECSVPRSLLTMLTKVPEDFPLRVFMTSRPALDMSQPLPSLQEHFHVDEMTMMETRSDIEMYLRAQVQTLPLSEKGLVLGATQTILDKAHGSFLWVSLVADELRSAYTPKDVQQVIHDVPLGMEPLYLRILNVMSASTKLKNSRQIIKAILLWLVCAVRPLTVLELECALTLELGHDSIAVSLKTFIALTCDHLIQVDEKSGTVSARHETLRAFLSNPDLESEFAVDKLAGHARIADICLQYLNGDEMRPPRSPMMMVRYRDKVAKRSSFARYACLHFSYHLRRSHSGDSRRFIALCRFLTSNVYAWIEFIARSGDMHHLVSTARDLQGYLLSRAKYSPPMERNFRRVDRWETDLIRLASQFGRSLIKSPSAIFWLIPPFCPLESAIRSQFTPLPNSVKVVGLSAADWSDRISSIYFQDRQPRVIANTDASFAVGLSDKSIKIFSRNTCQEQRQLKGSQAAKVMVYSSDGKYLTVATIHFLEMHQADTGRRMWQARLKSEVLSIVFADNDTVLRAVDKTNHLRTYSTADGTEVATFVLSNPIENEQSDTQFRPNFNCVAISTELNIVAATHRGSPLGLYDLAEGDLIGCYRGDFDFDVYQSMDHAPRSYRGLVFNPQPESTLLAGIFHDGSIVVLDSSTLEVKAQAVTDGHQVLACAPDGRTLVTGSDSGTLQLFEFETLKSVCKIISVDYSIRSIAFTTDSRRLLDIRGSQCNIWEPSILVRTDESETDSVSEMATLDPTIVVVSSNERMEITAVACHPDGQYVFCGKEDGGVFVYLTTTGEETSLLYAHAQGIAIMSIQVGATSGLIVSTDAASRVIAWQLANSHGVLSVTGPVLDKRIPDHAIRQLLLSRDEQYLMVSTLVSDTIYKFRTDDNPTTLPQQRDSAWKWVHHPTDSSKLIHMTAKSAHVHSWNEPQQSACSNSMTIHSDATSEMAVKEVIVLSSKHQMIVEYARSQGQQSTSHVLIFSGDSFGEPLPERIEPLAKFATLASHVEHLIGCIGKRVYFLDREMWICSFDLDLFAGVYDQHCCIPGEWLSANGNLILRVTSKGDFVFVKRTEIAIIKQAQAKLPP